MLYCWQAGEMITDASILLPPEHSGGLRERRMVDAMKLLPAAFYICKDSPEARRRPRKETVK